MTNLNRFKMELNGIDLLNDEAEVYLLEVGLDQFAEYNPTSNTNKRKILQAALAVLESIANSPQTMKNYKIDDMTITQFYENLQNRIDALEKKIRAIPDDDKVFQDGATFNYIFSS
ncbi:MAG: hypothetical protein K6T88_06375 [Bacillus sp. (in: Bacteria)]|nr:hypothetical protein [Bacillus sp. (in: firmicutes)]